MKNGHWLTAKDVVRVNALKYPKKIAIKDLYKEYNYKQWDERSCRLANVFRLPHPSTSLYLISAWYII